MEFVFKPEKLTEDLNYQISEAIAKRTEIYSRNKLPGLWKKTDELNRKNLYEACFKRRIRLRRFYGIVLIALGIFLFVPGIVKPKELFVPLIVGAFSIINGIFAVIPRKTDAERFLKKAKKLAKAINSSVKPENTLVFSALSCQFISNVPSAILLSQFTDNYKELLLGVNIGGAGTMIASLASLITFREYSKQDPGHTLRYILKFSAFNFAFLGILICVCLIFGV
jgi:hypothetical protein